MKVDWQRIQEFLVDPVDHTALELVGEALVSESGNRYPLVEGQPFLLSAKGLTSGGWSFAPIKVGDAERRKPTRFLRKAVGSFKRAIRHGVGGQGAGARLLELIRDRSAAGPARALVVGGATVGHGCGPLVSDPEIDVISFDVYPSEATTFVGDAHQIPLADSSVSAVWIQAVLEHVYRPEVVVAEIARVLEPGGLLYAETPFLQPVHEGAYDYTRFNMSGHRLLFAPFDELESGPLGGPAAVFSLSIRGVLGGVTRSASVARVAYTVTQPLRLIDRFISEPWRVDYATGQYFLGVLTEEGPRDFNPARVYRGAG